MNTQILDGATAEAIQFDRFMLGINTAIPGVIQSFDTTSRLASVKPSIQMKILLDGVSKYMDLPVIENVPVCLPHSKLAGLYLTVPIKAGDECLIIFSQRAIDNFVQFGGIQTPPVGESPTTSSPRHHDLTDAICIPSIVTMPNVLTNWNQEAIELRNSDRSVYFSLSTSGINIKGDVTVDGEVTANNVKLSDHVHSGVESGGSNTGGPI